MLCRASLAENLDTERIMAVTQSVQLLDSLTERSDTGIVLSVAGLAEQPDALRNRMIRGAARAEFGSHLSREHTRAVAALVTDWHGQGPINVPGATVERIAGRLEFRAAGRSTS